MPRLCSLICMVCGSRCFPVLRPGKSHGLEAIPAPVRRLVRLRRWSVSMAAKGTAIRPRRPHKPHPATHGHYVTVTSWSPASPRSSRSRAYTSARHTTTGRCAMAPRCAGLGLRGLGPVQHLGGPSRRGRQVREGYSPRRPTPAPPLKQPVVNSQSAGHPAGEIAAAVPASDIKTDGHRCFGSQIVGQGGSVA